MSKLMLSDSEPAVSEALEWMGKRRNSGKACRNYSQVLSTETVCRGAPHIQQGHLCPRAPRIPPRQCINADVKLGEAEQWHQVRGKLYGEGIVRGGHVARWILPVSTARPWRSVVVKLRTGRHGTVPIPHGAVPIPHGAVPIAHGAVPIPHGAVPIPHGAVPIPHVAVDGQISHVVGDGDGQIAHVVGDEA